MLWGAEKLQLAVLKSIWYQGSWKSFKEMNGPRFAGRRMGKKFPFPPQDLQVTNRTAASEKKTKPGMSLGLHIIATDSQGNIYTGDGRDGRVQKFTFKGLR